MTIKAINSLRRVDLLREDTKRIRGSTGPADLPKKKKAARKKTKTKKSFKPGFTPMTEEGLKAFALKKAGSPPILPPSEEES